MSTPRSFNYRAQSSVRVSAPVGERGRRMVEDPEAYRREAHEMAQGVASTSEPVSDPTSVPYVATSLPDGSLALLIGFGSRPSAWSTPADEKPDPEPFEDGDIVRCIQEGARQDGEPTQHEGDVFMVESVLPDIEEVSFVGHGGIFKARRFERVLTAGEFACIVQVQTDEGRV